MAIENIVVDHGDGHQDEVIRLEDSETNFLNGKDRCSNYYHLLKDRRSLPILKYRNEIYRLVERAQILLVVGETGSGKTTQIPQFLLYKYKDILVGNGRNFKIGCTQPRRVSAISVCRRVSEELDVDVGKEVGYSVRFEDMFEKGTVIKYMTDGMLLREMIGDKELKQYKFLVIDEAHERTISTDILLSMVKTLCVKRKDLKVIIMSATLDYEKFQKYFKCRSLIIPGSQFPVDIFYTSKPEKDYIEASIRAVLKIHLNEPEGDILLFLTGEEEIEETADKIRSIVDKFEDSIIGPLEVICLYAALDVKSQQRIFEPPPKATRRELVGRKLIIATTIAETSITIDGVVYVIDPGFSKQKIYNPRLCTESLLISPISKASARQRAGRAGRTRAGKCFRLYTKESFSMELKDQNYPEILRCNISGTVLHLKKLGVDDLVHFDFIDPPAPETLMRALEILNFLGALDNEGNLTETGKKMAELPLNPLLSKLMLTSFSFGVQDYIVSLIAMLSVQNIFTRNGPRKDVDLEKTKFYDKNGDHFTLLKIYSEYRKNRGDLKWMSDNLFNIRGLKSVDDIRTQLIRVSRKMGFHILEDVFVENISFSGGLYEKITKCMIAGGYFLQVAKLGSNGAYLTIRDGVSTRIHPSSCLSVLPKWCIYHELVLTSKNFIRTVTMIDPELLVESSPSEYFNMDEWPLPETKKELEYIISKIKSASNIKSIRHDT